MLPSLRSALIGAVAIAAISTLGDAVWANAIPRHRAVFGLAHGTVLLLCVGLFLGLHAGKPALGAAGGALVGLLAAASFYALAPLAGHSAMFPSWIGLWVALGVLNGPVLHGRRGMGEALARGLVAAVVSGIAFYAISGIWMPFDPAGWDYLLHFGAWTIAYFPGFAVLLVQGLTRPCLRPSSMLS